MASQNSFLTNWVRNLYSMEMGLIPVLERQAQAVVDDQQLQRGINQHLLATRRHAELMKGCVERLGDSVAGIQASEPVVSPYARADGGGSHAAFHTELIDFVAESYEIASYRALAVLAAQAGDPETARVCEMILRDELAMVHALDQRLPETPSGSQEEARTATGTVAIARASFDALNAQDFDRLGQLEAEDYQVESPGVTGTMNKQQERQYLRGFLGAFPDGHFEITRCIAEGRDVVLCWVATGTHTLPLHDNYGRMVPPSNRRVRIPGSTTLEIRDGLIRRGWNYWDLGSLMEQLGATQSIQDT